MLSHVELHKKTGPVPVFLRLRAAQQNHQA